MSNKSRILIVGGTGYIGRRIVNASLAQGHPTYVLMRRENSFNIEKLQMLLSFKEQGARLVEGSFSDHQSLVDAVKQIDVVICTIAVLEFRTQNILMQLKLVDAIKEAGNVKRFLPSEFGPELSRIEHILEPRKKLVDDKMAVRKAIEDAKIPYTYISANCLGGYFVGNLSQLGSLIPPRDRVSIYGDGNCKVVFMDEDDVATYTVKTVDDPHTLNKTLYLRPYENILTQNQLVAKWEKLTNKSLEKMHISVEDFIASLKGADLSVFTNKHY